MTTTTWGDRPAQTDLHWRSRLSHMATAATIRVFVVDDHAIFRRGVATVLAGDSAMAWVGEAANGADAVALAPALQPDVVLVDLVMPGGNAVATIQALVRKLPDVRVLALSCELDIIDTRRALDAGAQSVLLKSASAHEIVNAIHATHRGHRVLASEVSDALVASERDGWLGADLTDRERMLLALMARGLPNREISSRLAIAMPTVKFHITNILSKLHVENRTAAVLAALRYKLVGLE